MNLQDIRKYYETPTVEACNAAGIYRAENTLSLTATPPRDSATARLQFGEMAEQASSAAL